MSSEHTGEAAEPKAFVLPQNEEHAVERELEAFYDDIIFKSCMVQSQSVPRDFVFYEEEAAAAAAAAVAPSSVPSVAASAKIPSYYTIPAPWCGGDPSVPAMQPGAGIYTSPLTVNVDMSLEDVVSTVKEVLQATRMPFALSQTKFKVF